LQKRKINPPSPPLTRGKKRTPLLVKGDAGGIKKLCKTNFTNHKKKQIEEIIPGGNKI